MKKSRIVAVLLCLCLLASPALGEGFGGLTMWGADVTDLAITVNAVDRTRSLNGTEAPAQSVYVIVNAHIQNMGTVTCQLKESVKATLTWQGQYVYEATAEYHREQVEMLVETDGVFTFCLPEIAAMAPEAELALSFDVDGTPQDKPFTFSAAAVPGVVRPAFEYSGRHTDGLDIALDAPKFADEYNGERDDAYRWLVIPVRLINWGKAPVTLAEEQLKVTLTYLGRYGIAGSLALEAETLDPLHTASGVAVFKTPMVVATAEEDQLGMLVSVREQQWQPEFSLTAVPAPVTALMPVPDPEGLTGVRGILNRTGYVLNGKTYTVYQYAKARDVAAFVADYTALATANGYRVSEVKISELPALSLVRSDGLTALVFYDYSGAMLLMVEDGLDKAVLSLAHEEEKSVMMDPVTEEENQPEARQPLTLAVGDYFTFGRYEQDADASNGQEPIEWLVLEVDETNHKALLLSRYGVDAKVYNPDNHDVTWERCTLRAWLNREFLNEAFSAAERQVILTTAVDNSRAQGYSGYHTAGGNDTQDKVFLLSYAEADMLFGLAEGVSCVELRAAPTPYAVQAGAYTNGDCQTADGDTAGWWWLRSPGSTQYFAAMVFADGSLRNNQNNNTAGCVRPALWIDLASEGF